MFVFIHWKQNKTLLPFSNTNAKQFNTFMKYENSYIFFVSLKFHRKVSHLPKFPIFSFIPISVMWFLQFSSIIIFHVIWYFSSSENYLQLRNVSCANSMAKHFSKQIYYWASKKTFGVFSHPNTTICDVLTFCRENGSDLNKNTEVRTSQILQYLIHEQV